MKPLSPKQERILAFIQGFMAEKSYPPTIRDIVKGCQLSSTSVADYNLNILAEKGYIRRGSKLSRCLEVVGWGRRLVRVPVIGRIAAGEPIPVPSAESWVDVAEETLELTEDITRGRGSIYALRVKGTSMVDALINDGDIVLMQAMDTADNGDMVAVRLKAENEVTLKRFYAELGRIRLQPANTQMEPLIVDPANVEVQGRVVAVIRQL